jgi:hypothetical protein
MTHEWNREGRLPRAQVTKPELDKIIEWIADSNTGFTFLAKYTHRQRSGATVDGLRQLQDSDRWKSLTMTAEYGAGDRLKIDIDGRGCQYAAVGNVSVNQVYALEEEWAELDGRARVPLAIVRLLRFVAPSLVGLGWLAAGWQRVISLHSGWVGLLLLATVSTVVFVVGSFGKKSTFQSVRAANRPFIAHFERTLWRDARFVIGNVLLPALNLLLLLWLALGR